MDGRRGTGAGLTKGSTGGILASSVLAAASTMLITIIAARSLGHDGDASDYAEFMVFWSLLFGVYGVVVGMQNETTRAVGSVARQAEEGRPLPEGTRVMPVAFLLSLGAALVVGALAPWWGPRLTGTSMPWVVVMVVTGIAFYGIYEACLGAASGLRDWGAYSWLVVADGVARLLLVLVAALWGLGLLGLEAACVAATLLCLVLLLPLRRGRRLLTVRADVAWPRFVRNCLLSFVSSSSTAILVTAFPAIIRLTSTEVDPAVLAGTITVISLTRSPILMPLQAFQGVAISAFLRARGSLLRPLMKPVALIAAIGVVGAVIAGAIGPWLLAVLYGPSITAAGWTFAALTIAAIPLAVITLTGTATVASNAHAWFSGGWFTAALVSIALLFLPLGLPERVSVALFVGPVVGSAVHLAGIQRVRAARVDAPGERSSR